MYMYMYILIPIVIKIYSSCTLLSYKTTQPHRKVTDVCTMYMYVPGVNCDLYVTVCTAYH